MPQKGAKPTPKCKPRTLDEMPRAPSAMFRTVIPDRTKKDLEPIPVEIWDYKVAGDGILEAKVEVLGKRTRLANRKYATSKTSTTSTLASVKTNLLTTADPGQTCDNCKGTCIHPDYWCRFLSLGGKIFCNNCGDFLRDNGFARPGPWNAAQSIHPPLILSIHDVVLPHDFTLELSDTALEKIRQDHNTAVLRRTDTQELMRTPAPEQLVEIIWKTLRIRKYLWKLMETSNCSPHGEERKGEDVEMGDAPADTSDGHTNDGSVDINSNTSIPLEADLRDQLTIEEASELYKILAQQWSTAECDGRARWSNIDMWIEAAEKMNHKFEGHAIAAGVPLAPRLPNVDGTRQYTTLPTARPFGIRRFTGWRLMALAEQLSGPMQETKSMHTELKHLDEVGVPFSVCFGCLDDADGSKFTHLAVAAFEYQNADCVDDGK